MDNPFFLRFVATINQPMIAAVAFGQPNPTIEGATVTNQIRIAGVKLRMSLP